MRDDPKAGGAAPAPCPAPPIDDLGDGLAAAFVDIEKDLGVIASPTPPAALPR